MPTLTGSSLGTSLGPYLSSIGGKVKHRINGCPINLRALSDDELADLMNGTADRLAQVREELDSLGGEQVRRSTNVIPLLRGISAPPYLMDPA